MNILTLQAAVFDAIDEPVLLIGADGVIQGANASFFRNYPKKISELFDDAGSTAFRRLLNRAFREETAEGDGFEVFTREGLPEWCTIKVSRHKAGDQVFLIARFKNNFENIALLGDIFEQSFYVKDIKGRFIYANKNFCQLLDSSLTPDSLRGKTAKELFGRDDSKNRQIDILHKLNYYERHSAGQTEGRQIELAGKSWELYSLGVPPPFRACGVANINFLVRQTVAVPAGEQRIDLFFDMLLDSFPQPVFIKDSERNIIDCNAAYAAMFNKKPYELKGKNNQTLLPAIADSLDGLEDMLAEEQAHNTAEAPLYDADGEPAGMARYKVIQCVDNVGRFLGRIGIIDNITEEKEQQDALIDARHRLEDERSFLQQVLDSLPMPLYVKDKNGLLLKCNVSFAKTVGKTPLEIIGKRITDLNIAPDLAQSIEDFDMHFSSNPTADTTEMFFVYPNGMPMRTRGYYSPIYDRFGDYSGFACILFDITEEWDLYRQLYDTEERWQLALKATNDAIWDFHFTEHKFIYYNRLLELLKFPYDLPRQSIAFFYELIHPEDLKIMQSFYNVFLGRAHDQTLLAEVRMIGGDNVYRWVQIKALFIYDNAGKPLRGVGVLSDISDRKNHEQQVQFQATHDLLTGLPNRAFFDEELVRRMNAYNTTQQNMALCMLDLDGFKKVNDTLGHQAGDELLRIVAGRLRHTIAAEDFVSRIGGDEFVFLVSDFAHEEDIITIMRRVIAKISEPIVLGLQTAEISGSIGVAFYPLHSDEKRNLVRCADTAMYRAKALGHGHVVVWTPSDEES
jgi:diguanylate cyclase (GGDEF)-like protein/PAS domain S-box-containing protein